MNVKSTIIAPRKIKDPKNKLRPQVQSESGGIFIIVHQKCRLAKNVLGKLTPQILD